MESVTLFAQMPATPEPIIAQVRRQLADDAQVGARVPSGVLDRLADQVVRELWGSPIKTFVPVLALRQAREVLQEQDWLVMVEHGAMDSSQAATTMRSRDEPPRHDVLSIHDDVLPRDERDVLPF